MQTIKHISQYILWCIMRKYISVLALLALLPLSISAAYALTDLGDDVAVDSLERYYVDGGSDTFFSETSPDFLTFVSGGVTGIQINSLQNVIISPGKGFFMDGGGDSYLIESTPNVIEIFAQSTPAAQFTPEGIVVPNQKKLFFDSGGFGSTTYITEAASNRIDMYTSSTLGFSVLANQDVIVGGNVGIGTSPTEALDVAGNIRLTGNILSPGDICIGAC